MTFELQFLGGAGTVTGSKYLITYKDKKILIDCGLFQGIKSLRLKNWDHFPIDPLNIDCIILTHAHIDHSGYIPRLVQLGFRGTIYSTQATKEVAKLLLLDSGYLLEEEAAHLNRIGKTKHHPALPLFTVKDAEESLKYFKGVSFNKKIEIAQDFSFEFHYVGHILGAASVLIEISGKKIAFTGDVGRLNDNILYPPAALPQIDYLVTESTYGNRLHEADDDSVDLERIINDTYKQQGVILIPAFAVGRAQSIMYLLSLLRKNNRIPKMPVYLNSPMATNFNEIFISYKNLHKLSEEECNQMASIITFVKDANESKDLNKRKGPMIIISASGMLTGGRILFHLQAFAPFPQNTILLTGYQAVGTRGEALQRGAKEIKIHGSYVSIEARVETLKDMSAHADYKEMIQWFNESNIKPVKVFITHGEAAAADEFRRRLVERFSWDCTVPELNDKVTLG